MNRFQMMAAALATAASFYEPSEDLFIRHAPRRSINGGTPTGAAAAKRAARKRRNIRKNPRGAA